MTEKQAFPSSITGNGSQPAGSVLDHKFGTGTPYTLGVEELVFLLEAQCVRAARAEPMVEDAACRFRAVPGDG